MFIHAMEGCLQAVLSKKTRIDDTKYNITCIDLTFSTNKGQIDCVDITEEEHLNLVKTCITPNSKWH